MRVSYWLIATALLCGAVDAAQAQDAKAASEFTTATLDTSRTILFGSPKKRI